MPTTDLATGHIYDSHPLPGLSSLRPQEACQQFPFFPGWVTKPCFLKRPTQVTNSTLLTFPLSLTT